jgi:hypothetical protein
MANLIVLGTIVYVTYFFMRITAYCVLGLIGALSFKQGDGGPLLPLTSTSTWNPVGPEGR